MAGARRGWIDVVEAAYALDGSTDRWLADLVRAVEPVLDLGLGCYGQVFEVAAERVSVRSIYGGGLFAGTEAGIQRSTETAPTDAIRVMFDAGIVAGSISSMMGPLGLYETVERMMREVSGGRLGDVLGLVANDNEGWGVSLAAGCPERTAPPAATGPWLRASAHVAAGLRLRRRLAELGGGPEAVLQPDGRPVHLEGEAESLRERLREAAVAMDRARARRDRMDPDEGLALWTALVEGRWSLVDRFESDGRRFVVAHRNEPGVSDPRGLSPVEQTVAELLGRGRTVKEAAYELGVTTSAVKNAAGRARAKLGIRSTPELVSFFAPGGVRARLVRFSVGDQELVLGSGVGIGREASTLSEAEREVALLLLRGHTNESIAKLRRTSARTVANQVASIYRKLGVSSRAELASRLSG